MNTIQIPKSLAEAATSLGAIDSLLTAKGWERAAVVAAFVRFDTGTGGSAVEVPHLSARSFAALGIAGLKSDATVRLYVNRWLEYSQGVYPEIGAEVLLPDTEWEATRTGTNGTSSTAGAKERLSEMAARLDSDELAEAIREAAPEAAAAVAAAVIDHPLPPKPKPKPVPANAELEARMDTMAMISTAAGHLTALKLRWDREPDSFEPVDTDQFRRLSDAYGMLADIVGGFSSGDLDALISEVK